MCGSSHEGTTYLPPHAGGHRSQTETHPTLSRMVPVGARLSAPPTSGSQRGWTRPVLKPPTRIVPIILATTAVGAMATVTALPAAYGLLPGIRGAALAGRSPPATPVPGPDAPASFNAILPTGRRVTLAGVSAGSYPTGVTGSPDGKTLCVPKRQGRRVALPLPGSLRSQPLGCEVRQPGRELALGPVQEVELRTVRLSSARPTHALGLAATTCSNVPSPRQRTVIHTDRPAHRRG